MANPAIKPPAGLESEMRIGRFVAGMVGAVIVGNPAANAAQTKAASHPGKARQTFASILK